MRRGLVLLALVGACGGGQQAVVHSDTSAVVRGRSDRIPPGTTIWLELDQSVSPERNRVGDQFLAHVKDDVVNEYGELMIPEGARVDGTIVDLRPGYGDQPAAIGLRVEGLEMAGHRQRLNGTIVDTDLDRGVRGKDVLIGAAAGAILGGLVEGGKGALVGGALGGGAGALISLGRGDNRVDSLPKGTDLAIRLEAPVRSFASIRGRTYY